MMTQICLPLLFFIFLCVKWKVIGLKVIICIQGHTAVAQILRFFVGHKKIANSAKAMVFRHTHEKKDQTVL